MSPLLRGVSKTHSKWTLVCGLCTGQGQSYVGESNQLDYFTQGAGHYRDVHEVDVECIKIVAASQM